MADVRCWQIHSELSAPSFYINISRVCYFCHGSSQTTGPIGSRQLNALPSSGRVEVVHITNTVRPLRRSVTLEGIIIVTEGIYLWQVVPNFFSTLRSPSKEVAPFRFEWEMRSVSGTPR